MCEYLPYRADIGRRKIRSGRTAPLRSDSWRGETEVVYDGRSNVFANTAFVPISNRRMCIASANATGLFERKTNHNCWTSAVNFGDFAERSCDLDSFCTPRRY